MQVLGLLLDVVIGVVLAGAVAPLALFALPADARGSSVLFIVAVGCIFVVAVVRRLVVGGSRTDGNE